MAHVLDRQADLEPDRGRPARVRLKGPRSNPPAEALHRIIVVGGGAAGLELVTRLGNRLGRRGRTHVALVECARTHVWKPLLHEVAAGSLDPGEYEVNYFAQAHWHGFHYQLGAMTGLDRIDPARDIRIVLIEAAERVLPGLPERISKAARRLLDGMGVEVRTSARVTEGGADGLTLGDGTFIASELVVWAAGVRAPEVLGNLDNLEVNRINQVVVEPTLQTTRDPDIFAVGDCAACPRRGEPTPVPPRAQAAHQEAAHLTRQIERRLRGEPLQPYVYRDFGSLVSLGRHTTVGSLMGLLFGRGMFIEGLFARAMYHSLRLMHERTLNGTAYAVLGQLSRASSRRTGPPVKLH